MNRNDKVSGGVGLPGLVFVALLVLKLTGTIDWSWWWVTAPLWLPFALLFILFLAAGFVGDRNVHR